MVKYKKVHNIEPIYLKSEKDLSDAVAKYGFTAVEPKLFKLIKDSIWNGLFPVMYQVLKIVDGGQENSL